MGYQQCLELAGAKILNFAEFGSYQGDWLAFVEYKGEKGIIHGYYGSCSGCDAYLAEFDYDEIPTEEEGIYYKSGRTWDEDDICSKEEYDEGLKKYEERLIKFGESYLTPGLETKEYYERRLKELDSEDWFDEEEKEYIQWALKQDW